MPDRLISIFGTYDFLGKSLPGMCLVIGLAALLPLNTGSLPDISVSFLLVLSGLLIVGLIGTLLGEFVHSLAGILERVVAVIIRGINRVWRFFYVRFSIDARDRSDRSLLVFDMDLEEEGEEETTVSKEEIAEDDFVFRQLWRLSRWVLRRIQAVVRWKNNQIRKLAHVIWSHREIFSRRIQVIDQDAFRMDKPIDGANFSEERFIKEIVVGKYGVSSSSESDQVYQIAVSELTEAEYDRAFRFQARYSFCRSMWLVLTVLSLAYFLTVFPLPNAIPNELLTGDSLIASLDFTVRWFLCILLFAIAVVFAFASGSYKKYYIDYIISELVAKHGFSDRKEERNSSVRRAS